MLILNHFHFRNIGQYIRNVPYYYKRWKYYRYLLWLKKNEIPFGTINGGEETYIFDKDDITIPFEMYNSNSTFDKEEIDLLFDVLSQKNPQICEGGVFLDIGANIGTTSIYVSKHILDSSSKILAFEPDAINYRCLSANIELNKCNNIIRYNIALSNQNGSAKMLIDKDNRGGNRISFENTDTGENVKTIKLDDFLDSKQSNVDKMKIIPSILWIDTEGHEPFVIDGAKKIIEEHRPYIFMEFICKNYQNLITSESEYKKMIDELCKFYRECIIFNYKGEKLFNCKIETLHEVYDSENKYYNVLLLK